MRYLAILLVALIALSVVGALWESRAEAIDVRTYPPPGVLVDVWWHRLHIVCVGTGSPTVVIDAGLGDWSTTWSLVQPEVAKSTRTCTYDRAGSGWSDPDPQPRVASAFARELHTLLARADEPGHYVLVGHSMGGLTMQLFAREYASEVAGLVLIESMNHEAPTRPASELHTQDRLALGIGFLMR
ncbi:MAG: alpha/beta fold hydrolase [Dehalococcoidia bacterium]|nr:alpha/beta fold hydrolase [Dehalococcoidia bacterium]